MNVQSAAPFIAAAVIVPLIILRKRTPRPLNVGRLWIFPAVAITVAIGFMATQPAPAPVAVAELALAMSLGFGFGWLRALTTRMRFDPQTQAIITQTSSIGFVVLIGLFALRYVLREQLAAGFGGLPLATVTDAFFLFATGMVIGQRIELWLRSRRLLTANAAVSP